MQVVDLFESKNKITGDLALVNAAVRDAANARLSRLPEEEQHRVMHNLKKYAGSQWAASAIKGMAFREMLERMLNGQDVKDLINNPIWGKVDISSLQSIASITKLKASGKSPKNIIKTVFENTSFIGENPKTENDVSTSQLNCNPTAECCINCYASRGTGSLPAKIIKSEMTEFLIEHFPAEVADRIVGEFAVKYPNKNVSLRINDKGDLSIAQVHVIRHINKRGVALQIFSKRPELLQMIPSINLRLFSVDSTNIHTAAQYPDLKLAVTIDNGMTEETLSKFIDQTAVIFPQRTVNTIPSRSDLRERFPTLYSRIVKTALCPADGGTRTTKTGVTSSQIINKTVDKKLITCPTCDITGGPGCFYGDRRTAIRVTKDEEFKKLKIEQLKSLIHDGLKELHSLGEISHPEMEKMIQGIENPKADLPAIAVKLKNAINS